MAPRRDSDSGRVSLFLAIAFTGLLMVLGVAVDASGQLRTLMRADNLAAEAARAAGQAIDVETVAAEGEHRVDPALAAGYAETYLASAGHDIPAGDRPVSLSPDGTAVEISVTLTYELRILGLFGLPDPQVTGTSRATLVTEP